MFKFLAKTLVPVPATWNSASLWPIPVNVMNANATKTKKVMGKYYFNNGFFPTQDEKNWPQCIVVLWSNCKREHLPEQIAFQWSI